MTEGRYVLKVTKDNHEKTLVLKNNFTIGRDEEMDLFIEDTSVSGQHAAIYFKKEGVIVEDFGSTNGTFVNSKRVKGKHELCNKDLIAFGNFKCTFIDTEVRQIKKYVTVCSSIEHSKEHSIKIAITDKKLSLEEITKIKTSTEATDKNDFKIVPVCPSCVYSPGYINANILKNVFSTQIFVTPLSRKVNNISLLFQRENMVVQKLTMRLNHSGYYAKKLILFALLVPFIFFLLDGVAFKTQGLSFITSLILKTIYAFGGFTVFGVLCGIVLTVFGLIMNARAQVIDLYYKELEFEL